MDRKLSLLGFAVMFLIGSDTFVVAPLLPSLAKAFDVSTTQSGWLVSVYAIGYALTGLVSGPISDRGNRRIILTLGMVVFALATAACAVSPGFWTMFIFRFITGGAAAIAAPQVWAMIPTLVGPDQKSVLRVMGYTTAGLSIAQVVGVPLGSLLAIIDWRIVFPIIGVCSLGLTVTLWYQIPDIRPTAAAKKVPYLTLLHAPQAITRFLSYLVYTLAFFTVFTYAPTWLEDGLGTSKVTVALIVLAGGIGNTIGSLFGVRLTGRMTPVRSIYLSAAVMGARRLPTSDRCGVSFPTSLCLRRSNAQRPYAPPAAARQHSTRHHLHSHQCGDVPRHNGGRAYRWPVAHSHRQLHRYRHHRVPPEYHQRTDDPSKLPQSLRSMI